MGLRIDTKRITKNERKSKQIPDNKALSGIPFIWQVAENSCFKHIRRSSHINLWNQSKENSKGKDHTAVLKIEEGCAQNSAITRLKNLKKIIRIALENDWIKKDPFAYYRFKLEETDPEFLTMDEIKIILAKEFTIKRVEQVRDIFVFFSFTGLAFSDVKDLSPEHLVRDNKGELWIRKNRQKTKIMCNIPVLPVAASILDKYKNVVECTGKLLPVLCNQRMNSYLKDIYIYMKNNNLYYIDYYLENKVTYVFIIFSNYFRLKYSYKYIQIDK